MEFKPWRAELLVACSFLLNSFRGAVCGTYDGLWEGPKGIGTSAAAAITSGMAAYYITDPRRQLELVRDEDASFAMKVEALLRRMATENEGEALFDDAPLASLGELGPRSGLARTVTSIEECATATRHYNGPQ
jgi:hypothetical protein